MFFAITSISVLSVCLFVYESPGQLCDVLVTNQSSNLISLSKLGAAGDNLIVQNA